jgi:phosphoglycerate dehydrogenase-like enzyme
MAQHAFFFALGLLYEARSLFEAQDARQWRGARHIGEKQALWGQTLGVVGFGHTGREMAKLGRAFGMHVMVYRRSAPDASPYVDVMLSADAGDTLDPLVEKADVVMLAANLSDETYHLFGMEEFRAMKSTSVIVNMSRGELIDEAALVEALEAGLLAGAGLDVFEEEPLPPTSPLWDLDNVILTPHATPPHAGQGAAVDRHHRGERAALPVG